MHTAYNQMDSVLRNRARRKVANNTYLNRRDDKTIAVTLHSTDVVTAHEDGTLTLNSGGWRTITTKDRINAWLPRGYILCQHDGGWFIRTPQETYEYEDLMTIPPEEF